MINRLKRFRRNEGGSITIEFSFMLIFLSIMLMFMFDLVLVRSTMGKLDNASHSMVNVLRERNAFYGGNEEVTSSDVVELRRLAAKLLYGDGRSSQKVEVMVESLFHDKDGNANVDENGDSQTCKPARPLKDNTYLSPYSETSKEQLERRRQIPVYQVTLCVDILSPFRTFLLNNEQRIENRIRSSSVAVAR